MRVVLGFLGANWRFFAGVLATGLLVWGVTDCQNRGEKITTLTNWVAHLDSIVADKSDTIRLQARRILFLEKDNDGKAVQIAQMKEDKANALVQAYQSELSAQAANEEVISTIARMNALQKKAAADRRRGGVGVVATTVLDTSLNADVASLKGQLANYQDTIVPNLSRANGVLVGNSSKAEGRAIRAEGALRTAADSIVADFGRSFKERYPMGIGQKKGKRRLQAKVITRLR